MATSSRAANPTATVSMATVSMATVSMATVSMAAVSTAGSDVSRSPRQGAGRALVVRGLLGLLGVSLLAVVWVGCGGEPVSPPETYTTRGIVRQLGMGTPGGEGEILIHHEAIDTFRDDRGEVVGMESMAMPFAVAEPTLAEGLEAGDRIGFTFEVRWEGGPPLQLTAIEALDDDIRLDFEVDPGSESPPEGSTAGSEATEDGPTAADATADEPDTDPDSDPDDADPEVDSGHAGH